MSNTWDYRFAFPVQEPGDVPSEFRSMYDRRLGECGSPVFGLFSPAMEDPGFILSHWLPPKLILLFPKSLSLLSLDTRSDQVLTFELSRNDFLGYGLAEFLLNCWFTLYPGPAADGGVQIRFPSRASQHYVELAHFLLDWSNGEDAAIQSRRQSPQGIPGLPPKFSNFLEAHPEYGPALEFFFQPNTELRKRPEEEWAALLLLVTPSSIVALTDRYRGRCSPYGIEMTYLPIKRVTSVDWTESRDGPHAAIEVCLKGAKTQLRVSWPIRSGLKPYAVRWIQAVESQTRALGGEGNWPGGLAGQGGEFANKPDSLHVGNGKYAKSRRD